MAELEARLQHAQDSVASDHADDVAFRYYGHLVNILTLHALQNGKRRLCRRGGMDAVERQHHRLDGGVRPFVARNHARGMQSDESDGADRTSYDVNAAPGSQHFVYIFFD